jgi:hypothetical protein
LAGSTNGTEAPKLIPLDTDEDTVATARSPFESFADETPNAEVQDFPTIETNKEDIVPAKESLDDEFYLLTEREERSNLPSSVPVEEPRTASSSAAAGVLPQREIVPASFQKYENDRPSVIGKIISSLLFLVLGAAAGVGGYYYWLQANPAPQVPLLTEPKSSNIPLTAFEEGRREVDRDPSRYLAANAASPQDAEDHYLLGRAQLLTGKYVEATRQFALAKERLPQVDPANAKTLAAEIAMGQTIASNAVAAEAFTKEMTVPSQPGSNSNTATNSANQGVPLR